MFLIRPDIKTLKEEKENVNWDTMCDMQGTLFHDKRSCVGNKERETTITNSMFYKKKLFFFLTNWCLSILYEYQKT